MQNKHREVFKTDKPIIGCLHMKALPGTPLWNPELSMEQHIESVIKDARVLMDAGFDGAVFANEADIPYVDHVGPEIVSSYTRIVTEVSKTLTIPFGVGVQLDPYASIAIAKATGAMFVRDFYTNSFTTDFGPLHRVPGDIFRFAKKIAAEKISVYTAIEGHYGDCLDRRPVEEKYESVIEAVPVAGYIISGPRTGVPPEASGLARLREIRSDIPIILNSGASRENIKSLLAYCDGVIVGTKIKKDYKLFNPIDYDNAKRFIEAAKG